MYNGNDHGVAAAGESNEVTANKPVKVTATTNSGSKQPAPPQDGGTSGDNPIGSKPGR